MKMKKTKSIGIACMAGTAFLLALTAGSHQAYARSTGVRIDASHFQGAKLRKIARKYDTNHNGYLSDREISRITDISIKSNTISDLKGIQYFTSVRTIKFSYDFGDKESKVSGPKTNLDFSHNKKLNEIEISTDQVKSISFKNCRALKKVTLNWEIYTKMPALKTLNLDGCKGLKELYINGSALNSLDLRTCPKISWVLIYSSYRLQDIKFSRENSMKNLQISRGVSYYNDPTGYDGPDTEGKLSTKYFKYLTNIRYLILKGCQVGKIDFTRMPALTRLEISSSSMSDMNLSKCSKLRSIELQNFSKLQNVQLPDRKKYDDMTLSDVPKLKDLNWKDLKISYNNWSINSHGYGIGNWGISGDFSSLQKIDVSGSNLTTLIIPEKNQVRSINAQNDKDLKELDLSNAKDLTSLDIRGTGLKEIDVSACEKLTDANILSDAGVNIIRR